MSAPPSSIILFTRRNTDGSDAAVARLAQLADEAGVELRVPTHEAEKLDLDGLPDSARVGVDPDEGADVAIVLGGDGSILAALRRYAGRETPVFALNFGAIGFLSTFERDTLDEAFRRALAGDFEVLRLPALTVAAASGDHTAVNDVSFHRRQDLRVAELGYSLAGEELGQVRCDGLVVATPAGSTGYNLANGGPVLAWGVAGYVVSFIAPHTLTARALVVAPDDELEVSNRSLRDPVDVSADGRRVCTLDPEASVAIRFRHDVALLAQVPGMTFYHRLRDKFGRLSY